MTTTATKSTNRALTLVGVRAQFSGIGAQIDQHPTLNYYRLTYQGQEWQAPTLVKLSQDFIAYLAEGSQL